MRNECGRNWPKLHPTPNGRAVDEISRRGFLKAASVVGSGLVLGFFVPGGSKMAQAADKEKKITPNAFLRIAPDDTITVVVNRLEFGQGVATSLPMLIAEELGADWAQMRAELAPGGAIFNDPAFGIQITGASATMKNSYTQYREIGAAARAMLIACAARSWQVPESDCHTEHGRVIGPSGLSASFGSLADAAMRLPAPDSVVLKNPAHFTLIGQPTPRMDSRAKSNGTQSFGIDFKLPNTKVALVSRAPVFGATVASFDATRALAIPGVLAVFKVATDRGGSGVAVVAEGFWPAKQARDALDVKWNTGNVDKVDSGRQLIDYKALAKAPGMVAKDADVSALAEAAKKITAEYEFPYLAHAPMEPLNCVVELTDTSVNVWAGTQLQTFDRPAIAEASGLKPEQISLNTMFAGGSFGRRAAPTAYSSDREHCFHTMVNSGLVWAAGH